MVFRDALEALIGSIDAEALGAPVQGGALGPMAERAAVAELARRVITDAIDRDDGGCSRMPATLVRGPILAACWRSAFGWPRALTCSSEGLGPLLDRSDCSLQSQRSGPARAGGRRSLARCVTRGNRTSRGMLGARWAISHLLWQRSHAGWFAAF